MSVRRVSVAAPALALVAAGIAIAGHRVPLLDVTAGGPWARPRDPTGGSVPGPEPAEGIFGRAVLPILHRHCTRCHGAAKATASLRLDSFSYLVKGGGDGPVIVAGNARASELYRRVSLPADAVDVMPPDGEAPLSPDQLALLGWWIERGASESLSLADLAAAPAAVRAAMARDEPSVGAAGETASLRRAQAVAASMGVRLDSLSRQAGQGVVLRTFNASNSFRDEELARLREAGSAVVDAELARTLVSDRGLGLLSVFVNLRRIDLTRTRIRRELAPLARLPRLEILNLTETEVDDQAVGALAESSSLRELYVFGTRVSRIGVAKLRAAMPRCRIIAEP